MIATQKSGALAPASDAAASDAGVACGPAGPPRLPPRAQLRATLAEGEEELVITKRQYIDALKRDDAPAYGVLATICVQHCGFRMQHVNNRVWATRCLPV